MTVQGRIRSALGAVICCGALAACGGSSTNVSGSGFIGYCTNQTVGTAAQCRCLQQKLVAKGLGGLDYQSRKAVFSHRATIRTASRQCASTGAPPTPSVPSNPYTTTT